VSTSKRTATTACAKEVTMMVATKSTMTRATFLAVSTLLSGWGGRDATAKPEVKLSVALGTPVMLAQRAGTAYLKVGLTGFEGTDSKSRAPVNLAVVLDRSGSMSGDKLEKAKEAAVTIVDRLDANDILSVVAYDGVVSVLVPATKVSDREGIHARIRAIQPGGATALFAGVSRGIEEVRKFIDATRVNRVILLSDGQANVGPSSANELGRLGAACAKEGISITTVGLGLGYNEDLMTQLAVKSDGNHAFAETPTELAKIFDAELGDVLSVVAQELSVKVQFQGGARPIRALNRSAEIHGETAILSLNQLYSRQEKYFLLEVQVPVEAAGSTIPIAAVDVSYANMATKKTDRVSGTVSATFTTENAQVDANTDKDVMIAAVEAIAIENNRRAVSLRDEGKVKEAQHVLMDNSSYLKSEAKKYKSSRLDVYGAKNLEDSTNLDGERWLGTRKAMRKVQHQLNTQQSY
jgi:Ca-activated chloride channel homolog